MTQRRNRKGLQERANRLVAAGAIDLDGLSSALSVHKKYASVLLARARKHNKSAVLARGHAAATKAARTKKRSSVFILGETGDTAQWPHVPDWNGP
jgi:hypothetical protein